MKLACARHLRDLNRGIFVWDVDAAERAISFLRLLRHYKGEYAGRPFDPSPWQCFIVGSIFGWKRKETGYRRFKYALVVVPRKNGKTLLGAGIGLNLLCADGEPASEVYSLATKEDQAARAWRDGKEMIRFSPGFGDLLRRTVTEIKHEASASFWRPLGADSETLDGLNPHGAICDELHAWKDRALWDVIVSGLGARRQPLVFQISTEGDVRGGIFDEQLDFAKAILESKELSDTDGSNYFAIIFSIDEGDDPFEKTSWYKANPELGRGKSLDDITEQAAKAKRSRGKLNDFLVKQLNRRVNQSEKKWLDVTQWDSCCPLSAKRKDIESKSGFIGLDLSRGGDLTAACVITGVGGERIKAAWKFWMPEDVIDSRTHTDAAPYAQWAKDGWLEITQGSVTDFTGIEEWILGLKASGFDLLGVFYDPRFAIELAVRLYNPPNQIPCFAVAQTWANLSPAVSRVERLVLSQNIDHGGNPIARWNAENAVTITNATNNHMLSKKHSKRRIDGMSALVTVVAGTMERDIAPDNDTPEIIFA